MHRPRATPTPAPRLALLALLALLAFAYLPGLAGGFVFDDYGNLDVLGSYGDVRRWPAFLYYLTTGNADPLGRPLSLLTFLADARAWPASPWPFKVSNLLLHLLNATLLWRVLEALQARLQRNRPNMVASPWTPATAAMLWAAHPLFVSTTLYVVQREAMLPMAFVLLAMAAWMQAIERFEAGRTRLGWGWAVLGVGGATVLAALSKANGLLAPSLVGVTHLCCLRPMQLNETRRKTDRASWVCLGLPSLLLLGYLVHEGWTLWSRPLGGRDWILPQRLLSEPRAIWAYVGRLALPRFGGGGVFVEDFPASQSWTVPGTTLPALLALVASVAAAWALRRRFPIMAFAWLFFVVGHALEGSTIALELYFEHRNYLPAMFLGWPVAHALLRPGAYPRYRHATALLLVLAFLALTRGRAAIWGDPALLDALAARSQEHSVRAQVRAAQGDIDEGRTDAGLKRIHAVQSANPRSVDAAINAVGMECQATRRVEPATLQRATATLASARTWNYGLYAWLQQAAQAPMARRCTDFGLPGVVALVEAAERNPQNRAPTRRRDLLHVRGRLALALGDPAAALRWFDRAIALQPDPDYALVQAAALGSAGAPALGATHLEHYAQFRRQAPDRVRDMAGLHRWLLRHYGYYDTELASLHERLLADAASNAPRH